MIIPFAPLIRVFLAQSSDRPIVRDGLCRLLESCPQLSVVGASGDPEAAIVMIAESQPEVILLDTFECDAAALALLPRLMEAAKKARLVLLTACNSTAAQSMAIGHGALGIVRQDQGPDVLFKAIECVYRGEIWLERTLAASVLQGKALASRPAVHDPHVKISTLTDRETEVIELVCEGLKNQAIAERLCISEATVRHRLTSIFEKLRLTDRLELVIFAYRHGLVELPR